VLVSPSQKFGGLRCIKTVLHFGPFEENSTFGHLVGKNPKNGPIARRHKHGAVVEQHGAKGQGRSQDCNIGGAN
jgi:hypothetical protein